MRGEVPEGSGADTVPCEVPEGSGAETLWGSGGFWRRKCLVQIPCEVPEGSGADALWNCKGFRFFVFWHKHLIFYGISTFYGTNAEAFKLLGIAPEFFFGRTKTGMTALNRGAGRLGVGADVADRRFTKVPIIKIPTLKH